MFFSPFHSYWISSCAGSGKTTLLVERLEALLDTFYSSSKKKNKKKPYGPQGEKRLKKKGKILVLTFTRSASLEIQRRLGEKYNHSYGIKTLKKNPQQSSPKYQYSSEESFLKNGRKFSSYDYYDCFDIDIDGKKASDIKSKESPKDPPDVSSKGSPKNPSDVGAKESPKEFSDTRAKEFPKNPSNINSQESFDINPRKSSDINSSSLNFSEDSSSFYVVHTFHSFCWFLLQRFRGYGGLPKFLKLLEEEQSFLLWQEAIEECFQERYDFQDHEFYHVLEAGLSLRKILEELFYKRLLLEEITYPCGFVQKFFQDIAARYEKKKNFALDYHDVLLWTLHLFHHPDTMGTIGLFLHKTFDHILLDEGQDTNTIQWSIFSVLCEHLLQDEGKTLFALGDPKQCIYGFQGVSLGGYRHMGLYLHDLLNPLHSSKKLPFYHSGYEKALRQFSPALSLSFSYGKKIPRFFFYHHQDHYRCSQEPLDFIHRVFQEKSLGFFQETPEEFLHRGQRQDKGGVFWLEPSSLASSNSSSSQNMDPLGQKEKKFYLLPYSSSSLSSLPSFFHDFSSHGPLSSSSLSAEQRRFVLSEAWCSFLLHLKKNPFFLPKKKQLSSLGDVVFLFPRRNVFFYDMQKLFRKKGLMKGGYFLPKETPFFQKLLDFMTFLQEDFSLEDFLSFFDVFFSQKEHFFQWMFLVSQECKKILYKDAPQLLSAHEQLTKEESFFPLLLPLLDVLYAIITKEEKNQHPEALRDFLGNLRVFLRLKIHHDLETLGQLLHVLQLLDKESFFQHFLCLLDPLGPDLLKFFLTLGYHHKDKSFGDFLLWFLDHPVDFRCPGDPLLTTIHKTKGQEYPIVCLPDLSSPYYALLDQGQGRDVPKKDLEDFWLKSQQDYWSLLYVALTRCEDFLFFSSLNKKDKGWCESIVPLFFPVENTKS